MERKTADEYPQELLDVFHEYQHGDIDRRSFMSHITKFAVGGLTVAAIFEASSPIMREASGKPDDKDLARLRTVPSPNGNGSIKGYLARPRRARNLPRCSSFMRIAASTYIEDVARRLARSVIWRLLGRIDLGRRLPGGGRKTAAFRTVDGREDDRGFCRSSDVAQNARTATVNWVR
jgi:hypothetical protein